MKDLPVAIIVGRRNVGKSTLFNALIKKKKAIVDDHPGLTRDILSYKVNHGTTSFILSDTPGLDLPRDSELSSTIIENAKRHLEEASVIVLLLENPRTERYDHELLRAVRKLGKPIIVAVNKMDSGDELENMSNFYELGVDDLLPISSKNNYNIPMLLDKIADLMPEYRKSEKTSEVKIALVGKPNAGKSTLLNAFLGYERAIVSNIPGTTRDSVNESFHFENKLIEIIDTAGIRRKSRIKESVEYYSLTRSLQSIKDSDVVIHLIDAAAGMTDTDKKIADEIMAAAKPLIIAVNKWDAVKKDTKTFEEFKEYLLFRFYRAADFPVISISAKEKIRIHKLLTTAVEMKAKALRRIETSKLNKALEHIQKTHRLPGLGSDIKIYYATQVDTVPPQFKLFVKDEKAFRSDVMRFFQKEFQRLLDIHGIPVIIKIEGKKKKEHSGRAPKEQPRTVKSINNREAKKGTKKTVKQDGKKDTKKERKREHRRRD